MTRQMLISVTEDESQVAILEDNRLQELVIEQDTGSRTKGNIYKGYVKQVHTALQAAFIEYGEKQQGFLPLRELNSTLFPENESGKQIQHLLKEGMWIMVQVVREPLDHKGAALTTNLSIPGRYIVFLPYTKRGGVSKKIQRGEERDRLKAFLSGLEETKHTVIIRTAGLERSLEELKKDYLEVQKEWEGALQQYQSINESGLLLSELDIVTKTLRDYYVDETDEIWVDNPSVFQVALDFLKIHAPRKQKTLKLFIGERSLFASYNIEKEVEQLTSPMVKLPSGGEIVIEQTEALVSIDVNSARSAQESTLNKTAFRTNMEAAKEVARQLKLRNLGGLIVIDFIDMTSNSERKKVEDIIEEAMSKGKAQYSIGRISEFGLLELSRQRLAMRISNVVETSCPTCRGKGKVASVFSATNTILRSLREIAARGDVKRITGFISLEQANYLLNNKRVAIHDLELEFGLTILLEGKVEVKDFHPSHLNVEYKSNTDKGEKNKKSQKLKVGKTILDSYEASFENDFLQQPLDVTKPSSPKPQKNQNTKEQEKAPLSNEVAKQNKPTQGKAVLELNETDGAEANLTITEKNEELATPDQTKQERVERETKTDLIAKTQKEAVANNTTQDIIARLSVILSDEYTTETEIIPLYEGCMYQGEVLTEDEKQEAISDFYARLQGKSDKTDKVPLNDEYMFPFIDDVESKPAKAKASKETKSTKAKASKEKVTKATKAKASKETVAKETKATKAKASKETVAKETKPTKTKASKETVAKETKPAKTKASKETVAKETKATKTKASKETVAKETKPAKAKASKETVAKETKPAKAKASKETKATKAKASKETKATKAKASKES